MSAILKALKKLEQETAEHAGAKLTGGITGRPPKGRPGSLVVSGLIAFTLCIFSGVGILIYTQYTSAPESPTVLVNIEKSMPATKVPLEKMPFQNRSAALDHWDQQKSAAVPKFEFSSAGPPMIDKHQPDSQKSIRELTDVQPPKMSPKLSTDLPGTDQISASVKPPDPFSPITPVPDMVYEKKLTIEDNSEPAAALQPDVSVGELTVPVLPVARENVFTGMPVVKKIEPPAAVIKDPAVELQAISWSADTDKRMAIINGKICREKDRIAGYVIQSINSDDVVISKGTVMGKLVFEIR